MSPRTPPPDAHPAGEMEDLPSGPRKLPSLTTLFHVLWMRKWIALIAWFVVAAPVGIALSLFDLPKSYSATTVMRFPDVVGAQTNVMRDVAITSGQSILSILSSHQVLEGTITKLGLRLRIATKEQFQKWVFKDVKYTDNLGLERYTIVLSGRGTEATVNYKPVGATTDYKVHQGPIVGEGRLSFPGLDVQFTPEFLSGEHGNRVDLDFMPFDAVFQDLKKNVSARPLGGTNFEIHLKDRDPFLVADILSTLQSEFLDVYYGTTEVQDVGILAQMEKDLDLAKERLEKSQDDLSHYYAENPELSQQQGPSAGDNLTYLESRQTMDQLEGQKRRVVQAFAAREPDATPERRYFWALELLGEMAQAGEAKAGILRASLQEVNARQQSLRATLGPDHPRIKEAEAEKDSLYRQLEGAEGSLVKRIDQELAQARARVATTAPRQNYRPPVKIQLELERLNNVNKNNQNIYDRLLESYNRAKLVTGSEFFKVSVVDPARPAIYYPPSTKTRLLIAAAAVALLFILIPGLVLAWSLVFIRIWTKEDVTRLLGLKVLGVIAERKLKYKKGEEEGDSRKPAVDPMLIIHGGMSRLEDVEAFRMIREEIENGFRNAGAPGKFCLLITSCRPHEGKSTCAANLAVTFARKGKRTLLIDADFRLGRVAKIFNLHVATGLDTILDQPDIEAGHFLESASLVFQPTLQRNLVVAPRKSPNANAGELVGSDRFKAFVEMARSQFDVVILDMPPVMITPEPLSLADQVDGVVFVCRSGVTAAREAREAVDILFERNARVSCILNGSKISPFEENRYRKYSYYYQVQSAPEAEAG
ncbi:MAG: P-loop NTPase [Fibrobacteres bacterium]|nr:P-loop NTPase [Fibrobacterota bacterium]